MSFAVRTNGEPKPRSPWLVDVAKAAAVAAATAIGTQAVTAAVEWAKARLKKSPVTPEEPRT